jgi:hypothetical protein
VRDRWARSVTLCRVPSLFRRRSTEPAATPEPEPTAEPGSPDARRGYTPGKGRPTPKRLPGPGRRPPEAPPANRREASARRRALRAEQMEGMRSGDERYLLARDRGEDRALVRDIIDSRRNAGGLFFLGALLVIVFSSSTFAPTVRLLSNLAWLVLAVLVVADSVYITMKIRRVLRERMANPPASMGGLYFYGIMRGLTFRRMRMPRPRVKPGDPI